MIQRTKKTEYEKIPLGNGEVVTPIGTFSEAVKEKEDSQILNMVVGGLIAVGCSLIYLIGRLIK